MAENEKFATDMRDALKAMMEADPYYSDIPIITERLQNIDAKIEGIVGKAGGICIVLVTAAFEGPIPNLPGANFDGVKFIARTFENVKTNPTGKEAQHVALYTAALWSQLKPDALSSPLKLDDPGVLLGNDPRFLSYDTFAVTAGGTKIQIPRLEDVTIAEQPFAKVPVESFSDGARDYTWREELQAYLLAGGQPTDPDRWAVQVFPASEGQLEYAQFRQIVAGNFLAEWVLARSSEGVWSVVSSSGDSLATPPALPDGFEVFTESGFSLAHPAPGAAIFYTLDRSYPAPRNPSAQLFVDSFNAAPGVTVRARAWLAGYIPSAELKQII